MIGVRPVLVPMAQKVLSIAALVALVTQNDETFIEETQELLPIALLNFERLSPVGGAGLPSINLGWNLDGRLGFHCEMSAMVQDGFHALGFQPPLGGETIRGQSAL